MEDRGRNGSRASSEVDGGSSEFVSRSDGEVDLMRDLNKRRNISTWTRTQTCQSRAHSRGESECGKYQQSTGTKDRGMQIHIFCAGAEMKQLLWLRSIK
jgi:hypothetical protein